MSETHHDTVQRLRVVTLLLAMLALMCELVWAQGRIESSMARLQALDANGDGLVSQVELTTGPVAQTAGMRMFLATHFKAIDRNRDGHVSERELEAWRQRYEVSEGSLSRSLNEDPRTAVDQRDLVLRP